MLLNVSFKISISMIKIEADLNPTDLDPMKLVMR